MSSDNFVKIYGERLLSSSLWDLPEHVRIAFIGMLAAADMSGLVRMSTDSGLARLLNLSLERTQDALKVLEAPDPASRTPGDDGRRLRRVQGGWQVINHPGYREFRTQKQEDERLRKQRQRKRDKADDAGHVPDSSESPVTRSLDLRSQISDLRSDLSITPACETSADVHSELPAEDAFGAMRATVRREFADRYQRLNRSAGLWTAYGSPDVDKLTSWVLSLPGDQEAALLRTLDTFFADPYPRSIHFSVAHLARHAAKYLEPRQPAGTVAKASPRAGNGTRVTQAPPTTAADFANEPDEDEQMARIGLGRVRNG